MRVCVIGAGVSGISCLRQISPVSQVTCFEQSETIGGTWNLASTEKYSPNEYIAAAYTNLKTNTDKDETCFSDMPLPEQTSQEHIPRSTILQYLHDYCKKFDLFKYICFRHKVIKMKQLQKQWQITVFYENKEQDYLFDYVCICNGHFWKPFYPSIPGMDTFSGKIMHSLLYRDESDLDGKKVAILGCGTSGSDIAELLEKRGKAHSLYMCSKRFERVPAPSMTWLEYFYSFVSTAVYYKPWITNIKDSTVYFSDGTHATVDILLFCTGYHFSFPFFEAPLSVSSNPQRIDLFYHLFDPRYENVAFLSTCSVEGSIFGIAEIQAKWIKSLLLNACTLPSEEEMNEKIQKFVKQVEQYNPSKPMMVGIDVYVEAIRMLMESNS